MTDLFSDASLGEDVLKNAITELVEYNATITAGEGLNIESINSAGQAVVGVATTGEKAQFVAMFDGVDGDFKEAMAYGLTKVTFGGAVTAGAAVKSGATGKFVAAVRTVTVAAGTTGASGALTVEAGIACGTSYSVGTTNDTGLIMFMGGILP